jgi:rhodanese-related sulfurtransferase
MENVSLRNCLPLSELKQFIVLNKQQVKIIDVRSKVEFEEKHIPGAMHIELSQINLARDLFDKDVVIVAACGKGGGRSADALDKLKELGFKNAYWLCGGTFAWYNI